MDIIKAKEIALKKIKENNVDANFVFTKAKRVLGVCMFKRKFLFKDGASTGYITIGLSREFVENNNECVVTDVILHEIAHAIAGHHHKHDIFWRAIAKKIGCVFMDKEIISSAKKYKVVCPNCKKIIGTYLVRPRRDLSNYRCNLCKQTLSNKDLIKI
jgi:predicted SprT family Zn-dependent metalloprotease